MSDTALVLLKGKKALESLEARHTLTEVMATSYHQLHGIHV